MLALSGQSAEVWAGGPGGLASLEGGGWQTRGNELPLTLVSAIARAGTRLLVGGQDGLAVSRDGLRWERAALDEPAATVAAIALSPEFERDATALAATMGTGILRSTDGGREWHAAGAGLQSNDVAAIAWGPGEVVVAGTTGGLYRSADAGRAWRLTGPERAVAAVAFLPDGHAAAAYEDGEVAVSEDGGTTWLRCSSVAGFDPSALSVTAGGTLLLGGAQGILHSADRGRTWAESWQEPVLCFARDAGSVWAGSEQGVIVSDDGTSWSSLPEAPLADYRWLLRGHDTTLIAGPYSGVARHMPGEGWRLLDAPPGPLSLAATTPDGGLLLAGSAGLSRSADLGVTWDLVLEGAEGQLALSAFEPAGRGWAASLDGHRLLTTADAGRTWTQVTVPFIDLPIVALDANGRTVRVLTIDATARRLRSWRSDDGGTSWGRGHDTLVSLPASKWRPALAGSDSARRMAVAAGLPADRVVDAVAAGGALFALLPAGEVRWRPE